MLAVVMPLTAVALSEPPESVAPLTVVAPVITPLKAREVSVPTLVMFVYAVALLKLALVTVPVNVAALLAMTPVISEPSNAGSLPAAVAWTS